MSRFQKLSQTIWQCKLCAVSYYVESVIDLIEITMYFCEPEQLLQIYLPFCGVIELQNSLF